MPTEVEAGAEVEAGIARSTVGATETTLRWRARTDLLSVVDELEQVLGRALEVDHLPDRPGDVRHTEADAQRLRSLFPDVVPVGLPAGLAATVRWAQEHRAS